jgi:hypothetical protein
MVVQQQAKRYSNSLPPSGRKQEPKSFSFRKLILTLAIIVGGIIAVKVIFDYHRHQALIAAIKHGVLIEPPTTISPLLNIEKSNYPALEQLLKGKWGLVYISTGICKDTCVNNIAKMLDLHDQFISSTKVPYIMLVSLTSDHPVNDPIKKMLEQQYPTIWYVDTNSVDLQQFLNHVPTGSQTLSTDRLYIVNKQLEAIASYNPEIPKNDLSTDFHAVDRD